jgi:hypothetical protein
MLYLTKPYLTLKLDREVDERAYFHVTGILYFKITHCYQVHFDVIKALPYILSFVLYFSIVTYFRHLIKRL